MEPFIGDDLPTGHPVLIHFDSRLSRLYSEPQGTVFAADNAREIVFTKRSPPYELYGYYPGAPGKTPIPFWGDHYIKPRRPGQKPNTLWAWIKREVNREIFLRGVSNHPVPGKLYWTRSKKLPKLICPQYHRHLIAAYEAIWALIEAIRELSENGNVSPGRWKLAAVDINEIYKMARKLSPHVDHAVYRSPRFLSEILNLEVQGLAPHYQPIHEKLKSFSAEMFEVLVAELIRARLNYEVYWSYHPAFLGGEVDVYARSESRNSLIVLVVSCKFRTTSEPHLITLKEVEKLAVRLGEATKHERVQAQSRGISIPNVTVAGALFSNAREVSGDATALAAARGIAILRVNIPDRWRENPTGRKGIRTKDVSTLIAGDAPAAQILAGLESGRA